VFAFIAYEGLFFVGLINKIIMEECPFCQKMRRNVFTQKPIVDYFRQHFLNFEVDVESSG
jgi:thioredoxin-related protein